MPHTSHPNLIELSTPLDSVCAVGNCIQFCYQSNDIISANGQCEQIIIEVVSLAGEGDVIILAGQQFDFKIDFVFEDFDGHTINMDTVGTVEEQAQAMLETFEHNRKLCTDYDILVVDNLVILKAKENGSSFRLNPTYEGTGTINFVQPTIGSDAVIREGYRVAFDIEECVNGQWKKLETLVQEPKFSEGEFGEPVATFCARIDGILSGMNPSSKPPLEKTSMEVVEGATMKVRVNYAQAYGIPVEVKRYQKGEPKCVLMGAWHYNDKDTRLLPYYSGEDIKFLSKTSDEMEVCDCSPIFNSVLVDDCNEQGWRVTMKATVEYSDGVVDIIEPLQLEGRGTGLVCIPSSLCGFLPEGEIFFTDFLENAGWLFGASDFIFPFGTGFLVMNDPLSSGISFAALDVSFTSQTLYKFEFLVDAYDNPSGRTSVFRVLLSDNSVFEIPFTSAGLFSGELDLRGTGLSIEAIGFFALLDQPDTFSSAIDWLRVETCREEVDCYEVHACVEDGTTTFQEQVFTDNLFVDGDDGTFEADIDNMAGELLFSVNQSTLVQDANANTGIGAVAVTTGVIQDGFAFYGFSTLDLFPNNDYLIKGWVAMELSGAVDMLASVELQWRIFDGFTDGVLYAYNVVSWIDVTTNQAYFEITALLRLGNDGQGRIGVFADISKIETSDEPPTQVILKLLLDDVTVVRQPIQVPNTTYELAHTTEIKRYCIECCGCFSEFIFQNCFGAWDYIRTKCHTEDSTTISEEIYAPCIECEYELGEGGDQILSIDSKDAVTSTVVVDSENLEAFKAFLNSRKKYEVIDGKCHSISGLGATYVLRQLGNNKVQLQFSYQYNYVNV